MKNFVARFVRSQCGTVTFEDALTIFCLTIGLLAPLALMNHTIVQPIFDMLPGFR